FKGPGTDTIHENYERFSVAFKRLPGCGGRADKIGNCKSTDFCHPVAEPTHAPRMLDTIRLRETEILIYVVTHIIGIEMNGVEAWREFVRKRGFASTRQPHNENLFSHPESSQTFRKALLSKRNPVAIIRCGHPKAVVHRPGCPPIE